MRVTIQLVFAVIIAFVDIAATQFSFPQENIAQNDPNDTLHRHFPLHNKFPLFPSKPPSLPAFPTFPAFLTSSTTTTSSSSSSSTCICVPIGTCTGSSSSSGGNDGTGLLDIRIVGKPSANINITQPFCYTGLQLCCYSGSYKCGVHFPPMIGSPVSIGDQANYAEFPWQAVLLAPGDVYQGSGALIDEKYVLTAAHKVASFISTPSLIRVRLGEWDAFRNVEPLPVEELLVSKIIIHPLFNAANLKNDVALLRLASAVPLGLSPAIATACLPTTSFVGQRCYVSGWGKNEFTSGTYQVVQKKVDLPVLATSTCQSALRLTRLGTSFQLDIDSFICAGGEYGKDACTGDGGAPLVCQLNGQFYVVGLVAWGIGCGSSNIPGVYTNVAHYYSWIQSNIVYSEQR